MNNHIAVNGKNFLLYGFLLANFNLVLQPSLGVLAFVLEQNDPILTKSEIFTLLNHFVFTLISLVPIIFILKIPKNVCFILSLKHHFFFLIVGLFLFFLYAENTQGIQAWIFSPRLSYENTRVGLIWLWSLSFTFFTLFFCAKIFGATRKKTILFVLFLGVSILYFSGSKQFVLSFLLFASLYFICSSRSYKRYVFYTLIAGGSIFVHMFSLSIDSPVDPFAVLYYFDYFRNGSQLIDAVLNNKYTPSFLGVYLSEFYNYIPRGFGLEKPAVVGQMIYNYDLSIGDPVAGYSPAILRSSVAFADAGFFYPLFYFMMDLKFVLILFLAIACARNLKCAAYSMAENYSKILILLLLIPNFLPFYPVVIQIIFAYLLSFFFFQIKIFKLTTAYDLL